MSFTGCLCPAYVLLVITLRADAPSRASDIKKSFDGVEFKRETSFLKIHEVFHQKKHEKAEGRSKKKSMIVEKEQRKIVLMNIKVKIHWEICFSLCF